MGGIFVFVFFCYFGVFFFFNLDKVLELSFIFHISVVLYHIPTHNFLTLTKFQLPNLMSHSFYFTVTDAVK